ncbi:helix-turn-helix domain-containing protein [Flagellimonas sp.]|uniref:helix-turn-helix domain-containing protein n=1 Tax=Flagellimonas sp. TaxID=2058762 RepID=UPI003BAD0D3C|tara:strand:- start:39298 stop:40383 length:1086 start_codon:yes stop_codon:yes gene_type:complete
MEIIQLIAAFNFLMATGFIWYNRRKLDPAIYVFSFFLLGKGITSLSNGMIAGEVFSDSIFIYGLGILLNSFLFFYAPFLYFFAMHITKGEVSIKKYGIHFLPFILFSLLSIAVVFYLFLDRSGDAFKMMVDFRNTFELLYFLQVIGYTLAGLWILKQHQATSKKSREVSKWVKVILTVFMLIWLLFLVSSTAPAYPVIANFSLFLGMLLLIVLANITLFMLFSNPEYFYNTLVPKVVKSYSSDAVTRKKYDDLCRMVQEKELYKIPDLKIGDLSDAIGESARNTSAIINTYYEGNYYDFINAYRIEEAKNLLENTDEDVTILSILYEAGFNSKSVFNTVFKNIVGETPSSYRKTHLAAKYG